jgi:hypothetical protein
MATHSGSTTVNVDGPMGDDYTVVVSTVNGQLSVEIVIHNSEASLAPDGVMLYVVDPDGWVATAMTPAIIGSDYITKLPEALR